jgi:hypothetical protein
MIGCFPHCTLCRLWGRQVTASHCEITMEQQLFHHNTCIKYRSYNKCYAPVPNRKTSYNAYGLQVTSYAWDNKKTGRWCAEDIVNKIGARLKNSSRKTLAWLPQHISVWLLSAHSATQLLYLYPRRTTAVQELHDRGHKTKTEFC